VEERAIVFKQDEENKRKNYKYKKEGRMEESGKRVLQDKNGIYSSYEKHKERKRVL
jgi:hypothetical protein